MAVKDYVNSQIKIKPCENIHPSEEQVFHGGYLFFVFVTVFAKNILTNYGICNNMTIKKKVVLLQIIYKR